jgi:hypothetical protein
MTASIYSMEGAAKALLKSRRWLQEWLGQHPVDENGIPYYSPLGRSKTFDDNDLVRIRATCWEEERFRLSSSRPARAKPRTSPAAASTSGDMLTEARRLAKSGSRSRSSENGNGKSSVVNFPRQAKRHSQPPSSRT